MRKEEIRIERERIRRLPDQDARMIVSLEEYRRVLRSRWGQLQAARNRYPGWPLHPDDEEEWMWLGGERGPDG